MKQKLRENPTLPQNSSLTVWLPFWDHALGLLNIVTTGIYLEWIASMSWRPQNITQTKIVGYSVTKSLVLTTAQVEFFVFGSYVKSDVNYKLCDW